MIISKESVTGSAAMVWCGFVRVCACACVCVRVWISEKFIYKFIHKTGGDGRWSMENEEQMKSREIFSCNYVSSFTIYIYTYR